MPPPVDDRTPPPIYGFPPGPSFVYRVLKDFGFPVLVSIALGWWIVRQDDIVRTERKETIAVLYKIANKLESIDNKTDTLIDKKTATLKVMVPK